MAMPEAAAALKPVDEESSPNSPSRLPTPTSTSSNSPGLPLEFITLTSRPATQKSNFSYMVRSHAMQHFLTTKRNPRTETAIPKSGASLEVKAKSAGELSGKFKLNTWSRKAPAPRRKEKEGKSRDDSPDSYEALSDDSVTFFLRDQEPEIDRSDVYGILPISLGARAQSLLYHCHYCPIYYCKQIQPKNALESADNTALTTNAFAINYDDNWKPFSISDAALLHATLCLVAQHQDLIQGIEDSRDSLYHKGKALMLINERLLDDKHRMSEASITSVAILVILEAINGNFEAADAHQIGLMKMIKLQGGITSLSHNPVMIRVISWSDIVFATRWGTSLKLPNLYPFEGCLADQLSSTLHFSLPPSSDPICIFPNFETAEILQTLQTISVTIDNPDLTVQDKKLLNEALYHTEYRLLSLELGQSNPAAETKIATSSQDIMLLELSHAFTIAALLYLQIVIRELPTMSKVYHRLASILDGFGRKYDELRDEDDSLENGYIDVALWIMFMRTVATPGRENEVWNGKMEDLGEKERGIDWLRERLTRVAWRERICEGLLEGVWREML